MSVRLLLQPELILFPKGIAGDYVVPAFLPLYQDPFWQWFFGYGGRAGAKSVQVGDFLIKEAARRYVKILCAREVQKSIKQSVHSLLERRIIAQGREHEFIVTATYIMHKRTKSLIVYTGLQDHTVDTIKSYDDFHICWVEEAHAVTKQSLDILIPTIIRNPGYKLLFTYNRFDELDPCHVRALSRFTEEKTLKYTDHKSNNTYTWKEYRGDKTIGIFINGRSGNPLWNEGLEEEFIESEKNDPETHSHIWEGEPIAVNDFTCVSRKSVNDSVNRTVEAKGAFTLGLDVARFGKDSTSFYLRQGYKSIAQKKMRGHDTTAVCALADEFLKENKVQKENVEINVDDTGVGGGVSDQLSNLYGYHINRINFGNRAVEGEKYDLVASELWFTFKEQIHLIELLDIQELKDELCTRRWKMDKRQRRIIESKDEFKKRYKKSPDVGDSCILAFYKNAYRFSAEEKEVIGNISLYGN